MILTFDIILFGALILLSSRAVKILLDATAKVVTIAVGAKILNDKKLEKLIEVKSPKTQINIKNIRKLRKKPKVHTPNVICPMEKQHLTNQMINHFNLKNIKISQSFSLFSFLFSQRNLNVNNTASSLTQISYGFFLLSFFLL